MRETKLRTLLLSMSRHSEVRGYLLTQVFPGSNFLSCNAAGLEETTELGQGQFTNPSDAALDHAGHAIEQETTYFVHIPVVNSVRSIRIPYQADGSNPFELNSDMSKVLNNVALSFAGNVQVSIWHMHLIF